MAILTPAQLQTSNAATYTTNGTNSITGASARNFNIDFISSSITVSQTGSMSVASATSASYAATASVLLGSVVSSSYALSASYAGTASVLLGSVVSSSYAISSSFAQTASFVTTAQTASYVLNAISSSYAATSSYALNASSSFPYTGSATITGSLDVTGSIRTNQPLFVNNSYVNINGGGIAPNTNNAGDGTVTVLQMASTQSVGWNMFIDDTAGSASYDQINFVVESGQGAKFQDANGVTYALDTWLQIPSNGTGTNPAPQFTRGLDVTGSLTLTGSAYGNVVPITVSSNTASINLAAGNFFTVTLANSATTFFNFINVKPGVTANLVLTTGTVSTASFSSNVKQPSGSSYLPTSGSGRIDALSVAAVDTSNLYLVASKYFI